MRRLAVVLSCLLASAGLVLAAPSAQAADDPLPVSYSFLPTALLGGIPGSDAPGTNDWSCKPTPAHPRPVVLVHGTAGNRATNWQTYGPLLKNDGYCVFALTYGSTLPLPYPGALGGFGDMRASAVELGAFVDQVLAATGASKVDLIGHSQGTLMPNYYVKYLGGAAKVGSYISLAPLWHGTQLAGPITLITRLFGIPADQVPVCTACAQFAPGTGFMDQIRAGGAAAPGVHYVNIMSRYDELVVPYTSGIEAGMTNLVLQDTCKLDFAEHFEIAADRNAAVMVLNALDPAHPKVVPCVPVLPFLGGF
ncbi:esterase/lipase family protein [Marmoricola sp. RAF53]|uniref:esterase/lipase family protein n=1 Tax=Marmoricola sp. RAF53 TaxID=3233059 RepID=UPI003F9B1F2A